MARSLATSALVAYLFVLLSLTLAYRNPGVLTEEERLQLTPFVTIQKNLKEGRRGFWVNLVGNIVVFTPVGSAFATLGGRRTRLWHAAFAGFALSAMIETLQYQTTRRFTDVDDVILNTSGTIVGYLATDGLRRALGRCLGREIGRA